MLRIDALNRHGELIDSFDTVQDAVKEMRWLSVIPGECVILLFYSGERLVDVMGWGDLPPPLSASSPYSAKG